MTSQMITNENALKQYVDLMGDEGKELVVEIIDTMLTTAPENFQLLDASFSNNDSAVFRRAAHTLKTSCATVGAVGLAENFLTLEKAGDEGNLSTVATTLTQCIQDFQTLVNELLVIKEEYTK